MKKILLLLSILISSVSFSQSNCSGAVAISTNGDYVTGNVTGTYPTGTGLCWGTTSATPNALWYTFTAPSNGTLTVTSVLPVNPSGPTGIDTRVGIMTGTCGGAWTCISGSDDVDANNDDYRSEISNLQVTSGTTYYIVWDDRWDDSAFTFNLTFTAGTCFSPTTFYLPEYVSTSELNLYWDQSNPIPSTYEVDWSTNFSDAPGTGTTISASPGALAYSTANITGIPSSSNLRYYVRSNCNPELSAWAGPYYAYMPVNLPYSNDFESLANNYTDGFVGGNFTVFNSSASSNPPNYADGGAGVSLYTFNSTTAVSNARDYFRGINMVAGETATISFKTRLFSNTAPSTMTFNLTTGTAQSAAAQTTIIQSYSNSSATAYTTHTATFSAPVDGIYYFSIHNNSPIGATQTFLFLDTISITTNLSSEEFNLSEINVYPNPTENQLNINFSKGIIKDLSINDINGRTVKNIMVDNSQIVLDINDLNSGIYFLNINTDNGNLIKKIIKK